MERDPGALQSQSTVALPPLHPEEAFDQLFPEIEAVPLDELEPVNLDVRAVVMTVLGVGARIGPLREAMLCLPPDQGAIDKLPAYASALAHAQALYKIQAVPPNTLAEKAKRARLLRDLLFSDALVLVKRGVLDGRILASLKRTTGYCRTGFDLLALTALCFPGGPARGESPSLHGNHRRLRQRWEQLTSMWHPSRVIPRRRAPPLPPRSFPSPRR